MEDGEAFCNLRIKCKSFTGPATLDLVFTRWFGFLVLVLLNPLGVGLW